MEKVSLGNVGFRDSVRISDDVSERQNQRQGQGQGSQRETSECHTRILRVPRSQLLICQARLEIDSSSVSSSRLNSGSAAFLRRLSVSHMVAELWCLLSKVAMSQPRIR